MRLISLMAVVMGVGLMAYNTASAQPVQCAELKSVKIINTTITTAEMVAAGAFKPPVPGFPGLGADYSKLPAFCRISGSIKPTADSDILFDLWLPAEGWNGRFMQTGNGVAAGSIVYSSLTEPLTRGYAVANTDTGHQGAGDSFSWAIGHPEKLTDYAYRAVHELTVAGKAITAAHYGKAPEKSYWNGCSTGGRQGLMEAQRYPEDYDAIIAGAPANNWTSLVTLSAMMENNMGPEGLGVNKLGVLKEAALTTCDALDGVTDRVISEPDQCPFDPSITQCKSGQTEQCLTEKEVAMAKRFYAGVVDSAGKVFMPGTGPGSEQLWALPGSPQFKIGTNFYRDVVFKDPDWKPGTFDIDTNLPLAIQMDNGNITAMDPDISAFIKRGGKLITYHGTYDGLIPYGNTVNYFESVLSTVGKDTVNGSARLYVVPGMSHCSGGDGVFVIDWLTAMEEWIEQGKAPTALPGIRPDVIPGAFGAPPTTGNGFTRPICPYPEMYRYKGNGDNKDAANFECVAP